MLVISAKSGQLGNRLLLFANCIAFGIENKIRVLNPAFEEYAEFFQSTSYDLFCAYPPVRLPIKVSKLARSKYYQFNRRLAETGLFKTVNVTREKPYSFQDCIHFLASVRKFHDEPIMILIDKVPQILCHLLTSAGNVILQPAPANENPVLAARLAKLALYEKSPFEKTIYLDCDTCLLSKIDELYDYLDKWKTNYDINQPIKILHCTYPYRPQYAKNVTRSFYTRVFDRLAKVFLPNQTNNPWRTK